MVYQYKIRKIKSCEDSELQITIIKLWPVLNQIIDYNFIIIINDTISQLILYNCLLIKIDIDIIYLTKKK